MPHSWGCSEQTPLTLPGLPPQESPGEDDGWIALHGQRLLLPGETLLFEAHLRAGSHCRRIRSGHQRAQPGRELKLATAPCLLRL